MSVQSKFLFAALTAAALALKWKRNSICRKPQKKIINLIVDINNTLMFFDPSSGKTFHDMLVNLIVERTMGRVEEDHWVEDPKGDVTYWNFLMENYGKKEASKLRKIAFEEGQPLAGRFEELSAPLRKILQPTPEQSAQYHKCGIHITDPDGEKVHPIIPSFLDALNRLQKEGYIVNVKFSTFGSDLHVFKTLNAWLKGDLNSVVHNDCPTSSKISYYIAQQQFVDGRFQLAVWKIDDFKSIINQYDILKESFGGKKFEPYFGDLTCREPDTVYIGKEAITAAIASIQGHMFINNDYGHWAKLGKTPDGGKFVPENQQGSGVINVGIDDNALACMPGRGNVFTAHPLHVFGHSFFDDCIKSVIR